jgi:hypothetical protein
VSGEGDGFVVVGFWVVVVVVVVVVCRCERASSFRWLLVVGCVVCVARARMWRDRPPGVEEGGSAGAECENAFFKPKNQKPRELSL